MPTYEYRCPTCGHEFELFQSIKDEPGAPCPECGSDAERLISAGGGLLFKGQGFYITDYRSESYKKKAEGEAKKGSGGESAPAADASKPSTSPDSGSKSGSGSGDAS